MKKIVIIGNGTSVLDASNGKFINECDRVIRMNDFAIEGYEKFVGDKIDIFACGPQHVKSRDENFLLKVNEFWFPFPFPISGSDRYDMYFAALKRIPDDARVCHLPQSEADLMEREQKEFGDLAEWCPSTGYRVLTMALMQFPKYEVYVIGIDFFQGGWYWSPDKHWKHDAYITEDRIESILDRHPVKYEQFKIETYADQGRIHLL